MKTKTLNKMVLTIGFLTAALGGTTGTPAWADTTAVSDYVKKVDLQFTGYAATVHLKNVSSNKHVSAVKLQAMENALEFEMKGHLQCAQDLDVTDDGARMYFGPVSLAGTGDINSSATLHNEEAFVSATVWTKPFIKKQWITEAGSTTEYTVPLSSVKNGHPALRIDPVALIESKAEAYVQNGGSLVDFYKQDQEIVLHRPISLAGWCKKGNKRTAGFHTKNHTIQIKYEGDPAVYQPKLNALIVGGTANTIKAQEEPFALQDADFQPDIQPYIGKCVPDQNPKMTIFFNTKGTKQGVIDFRIAPESNSYPIDIDYDVQSGVVSNPKNGGQKSVQFTFPLKEMLQHEKYPYMLMSNKTYSHNMRIKARYRDFDDNNGWSSWKDYGTAVFKHRCTPQPKVGLGGANTLQLNNSDSNSRTPVTNIKKMPTTPPVKPLSVAPVTPNESTRTIIRKKSN